MLIETAGTQQVHFNGPFTILNTAPMTINFSVIVDNKFIDNFVINQPKQMSITEVPMFYRAKEF